MSATLIRLAEQHKDSRPISATLDSIECVQGEAACALETLSFEIERARRALAFEPGVSLHWDNGSITTAAIQASGRLTRLRGELATLAAELRALGEDVHCG